MPELPEVEGVVESLRPFVVDQTILSVQISEQLLKSHQQGKQAIIKGESPADFAQQVTGYRITALTRRSKYMFLS